MALHTQWQFFFRKTRLYDSDNRICGEYPDLYNENGFNRINDILGINLTHHKGYISENLSDIEEDIKRTGASIVLVNKYFIDNNQGKKKPDIVMTTVIITSIDWINQRVQYLILDENMSPWGWLSVKKFLKARSTDPHGRYKDKSRFSFEIQLGLKKDFSKKERIDAAYKGINHIKQSATDFLHGSQKSNIWFGAAAIERLAKDILTWPQNILVTNQQYFKNLIGQRIIDCGIYIKFVKLQRIAFKSTLLEIADTSLKTIVPTEEWINEVIRIAKKWDDLQMLLYLIGSRRQLTAVNKISQELETIRRYEVELQNRILDRFNKILQ